MAKLGADNKKTEWLKKMKAEGHKVDRLENEPELNPYEALIVTACLNCQSITDVILLGNEYELPDVPEFIDLVNIGRDSMEKENA